MTQDRNRQTPAPTPAAGADDGPVLDEPGDTITMSRDDLAELIREQVAEQVAEATADVKRAVRPTRGAKATVPVNTHAAPSEPTWDPPFMPGPEDFAEFNALTAKGIPADEPIPLAGTILVVGPDGSELQCTPKAYRNLYAARGYKAHPEDAARGLAGQARNKGRRRGGGNIGGESQDQAVAQGRRRRRRDDGD